MVYIKVYDILKTKSFSNIMLYKCNLRNLSYILYLEWKIFFFRKALGNTCFKLMKWFVGQL